MVKEMKKDEVYLHICEACGFAYKEKELAQKCENWCKERNSCSMEITKHAVKI